MAKNRSQDYDVDNRRLNTEQASDNESGKKFLFFGIASAICLVLHSIFLGIKYDYDLYKLFRRVIMLSFIVFEA